MEDFSNNARKLAFHYHEALVESHIRTLCLPILKNFGITSFNYTKFFYQDPLVLHLSTNKEWIKHFFMEVHTNGPLFKEEIRKTSYEDFYYFLWPVTQKQKDHILSAYEACNMRHGVTIYRRNASFIEAWDFASPAEEIACFFINNRSLLERFIFYFREKMLNIINTYDKKYLISF